MPRNKKSNPKKVKTKYKADKLQQKLPILEVEDQINWQTNKKRLQKKKNRNNQSNRLLWI
jgi:hypothetical protein